MFNIYFYFISGIFFLIIGPWSLESMVTFVATGTVIEIFEPGSFAPEMYLKQKDGWGKNYGILFVVFPRREVHTVQI